MKSVAILVVLAAASVTVVCALGQQGTLEPRDFKPARIAVVNISEVFEKYEKKKDIESRLEAQIKEEERKFEEQKTEFKRIQEELKIVTAGTDKHKELTLKLRELEYELKDREQKLLKAFQEEQMKALKEIRDEITSDINKYAEGIGIDIVLEKQIAAEGGKGSSIRWPLVHYVKPELEITGDIVQRLNTQYGKSGQPPAGQSGGAKGAKKP